jgi:hypothetical protein
VGEFGNPVQKLTLRKYENGKRETESVRTTPNRNAAARTARRTNDIHFSPDIGFLGPQTNVCTKVADRRKQKTCRNTAAALSRLQNRGYRDVKLYINSVRKRPLSGLIEGEFIGSVKVLTDNFFTVHTFLAVAAFPSGDKSGPALAQTT